MAVSNERDEELVNEYNKLGGTKPIHKFLDEHDVFLEETLEIFVYGDQLFHDTREEALKAVKKRTKMSNKELNLHLEVEDNLGGYT
jgi:hypothetical protein